MSIIEQTGSTPSDSLNNNPDAQAALTALASDVEAGSERPSASAQRDLQILASEVVADDDDNSSVFDSILEIFGTNQESLKDNNPIMFAVLTLFFDTNSEDENHEESATSADTHIINTNPYPLNESELEGYSSTEATYLREIASAGISPQNATELYDAEAGQRIERQLFFSYLATTLEACEHFQVAPDRMLSLIMAVMKMESSFNERASNASGATGLMQHMIGSIPERAARLRRSGAIGNITDPYDTRLQIFASVQYFIDGMSSLGTDLSSYPSNKFARDAYLIYNCGPGHAWLARVGALDWSNEQIQALSRMSPSERVQRYGRGAETLLPYAVDRLTRDRSTRVFDAVQRNYDRYRTILFR